MMKIAIAIVSITLTVMLIMQVYPLVTGGVNLENTEELTIGLNGTELELKGEYVLESSIKQDISDVTVDVYVTSKDNSQVKSLVSIEPFSVSPDNPTKTITIDESIPVAEMMIFFVTDNLDNDSPGMRLPITIAVKGSYSNHLAGIDIKMTYNLPISETASIGLGSVVTAEDGNLSQATLNIENIGAQFAGLIPAEGANFSFSIGGHELDFSAIGAGEGLGITLGTGDINKDSIESEIRGILETLKNKETGAAEVSFNGMSFTFDPGELADEHISDERREQINECIEQVEGICETLYTFLDAIAAMGA